MTSATSAVPVSVLDTMKCPICLDYATKAVETQCCEQIYCETCIQPLVDKECPSCRQRNLRTSVSKVIRRMIGDLPLECPHKCGEKVTRYGLIDHQEKCPQRKYQCPIKDCEFIGINPELIKHMVETHLKEVSAALGALAVKPKVNDAIVQTQEEKVFYCPFDACCQDTAMERNLLRKHIYENHQDEHSLNRFLNRFSQRGSGSIQIINSKGRSANMARNGKFYCGVREGSYEPKNENVNSAQRSTCSFDSRLNCSSCMKLDVTLRNLPYGFLVNRAGRVSTPNFCTHDVKDSEYFDQNFGRSALCTRRYCKQGPKFSCKLTEPKCRRDIPCKDCEALNFVYDLAFTVVNKLDEDVEYYKPVWEKN